MVQRGNVRTIVVKIVRTKFSSAVTSRSFKPKTVTRGSKWNVCFKPNKIFANLALNVSELGKTSRDSHKRQLQARSLSVLYFPFVRTGLHCICFFIMSEAALAKIQKDVSNHCSIICSSFSPFIWSHATSFVHSAPSWSVSLKFIRTLNRYRLHVQSKLIVSLFVIHPLIHRMSIFPFRIVKYVVNQPEPLSANKGEANPWHSSAGGGGSCCIC